MAGEKRYIHGFYAQTADGAAVTNTVTPTSVVGSGQGTLTIPADIFVLGDSFHAKIGGKISAQNNDTITIDIKDGATVLATTGVITLSACTDKGWEIELDFTVKSIGVAGVVITNGNFIYNRDTGSFEGFVFQDSEVLDTTSSSTLDIVVTWGQAKVADSIESSNMVLYKTY